MKNVKRIVVALNYLQARQYMQNMGFSNEDTAIASPDSLPIGYHPKEIWIVGELVKYYELLISVSIMADPERKYYTQPELPNRR